MIKKDLIEKGFMIVDKSEIFFEDFVVFVLVVVNDLMNNEGSLGIIVDSYGVGSFILVIKVKGMIVVVVLDECSVYMIREYNNFCMIVFGLKIVGEELVLLIVKEFL